MSGGAEADGRKSNTIFNTIIMKVVQDAFPVYFKQSKYTKSEF